MGGQEAHAQKTTQEKKAEEVRSLTTSTTESLAEVRGRTGQCDPLGVFSEAHLGGMRSLCATALYCIFNSRITSFYYYKSSSQAQSSAGSCVPARTFQSGL